MNVARKKFGTNDLRGKVFVSSGMGGMSGAQPKACQLIGCIGVIAEVSEQAAKKRYQQELQAQERRSPAQAIRPLHPQRYRCGFKEKMKNWD